MNQLWLAFITGITTGGISCVAVQGGLLASSMAQEEELNKKQKIEYVIVFLISKLIAYTSLGFALGALGSSLIISPQLQGYFQILVGIFMLLTVGRLLNIHPFFRYFVIQPPKSIYKLMRKESKRSSLVAPLFLGAMTIFIPCGVTQAMLLLTVASGSALIGAAIMCAFTLGTSPVFFAIGVTTLEALKRKSFTYVAALFIFILAVLSINTGQILRGSNHTLQNYRDALLNNSESRGGKTAQEDESGKQIVTINVDNQGYSTDTNVLSVNKPVRLTLISNNVTSCARSFVIPSLGITKILPQNGNESVEFTPTTKGILTYSCGMGMYTGKFTVI